MKAVLLNAYGDTDQFHYEDVPDPTPAAGELLVKVAASGFNPVDLYLRQGYLATMMPMPLPAIMGIDVAGTVTALGEGVTGFAVGDRVAAKLPVNGKGAHAELTTVAAKDAVKIPAGVEFAAAAAVPLSGLTGRQAVVTTLKPKAGQRIVVGGAQGASGRAAVQAILELGATPVAAVRGKRVAETRAAGLETIDLDGDLSGLAGSFDGGVDTAGAAVAGKLLPLIKAGGTLAGVAGFPEGAGAYGDVKAIPVMGVADSAMLAELLAAVAAGDLTIPVGKTLPLKDVAEGHKLMANGGVGGKLVFVA